jgi:SAM-dependent methyltransferase
VRQQSGLPEWYIERILGLEDSYLEHEDPIRQSGFGGGAERWRAERGPILDAIDSDGDILDVGCANGYLLECLVKWGQARGLELIPHGVDIGARLIALARERLPQFAANFHVGNAWEWNPPKRYRHVYALHDCVPRTHLRDFVERLLMRVVAPGGRLILGAYGSRSQGEDPFDVVAFLKSLGYYLAGSAEGGHPPLTLFAWIDASTEMERSEEVV